MASRALPIATVALALLVGSFLRQDALRSGFWSDDYLHWAMLNDAYPVERAPWDLFRFAHGGDDTARLVDYGYYPWWTHPDFRLSMLRPAASLLHAFDWRVFGLDASAHHLHSLVWWGLCVIAVGALLFSLLPRAAAAAAVLLFAIDESHTIPLLWLSNRSLLIATACATAGLLLHVRWRRGKGGRATRAASVALFALALLAGEYALAMLAYLFAFELLSRPRLPRRARALLPAGALALVFVVLWAALGYGTAHSGLYANPLQAPLAYGANLASGVPVLLGELVLAVPADFWTFGSPWPAQLQETFGFDAATWARLPGWHSVHIAIGAFAAALAVLLARWLARRIDPEHADALRWLCAGGLLAFVPVLGAFITSRLALPASIAFAALFGSALAAAGRELRRAWPHALAAAAIALLVLFAQVQRAATYTVAGTAFYGEIARSRTAWPLAAEIDDRMIAGQRLIMVASADSNDAPYLPFVRAAHGHPRPRSFRLLSASPSSHELRRIDAHTIELVVLDSFRLADSAVGSLTRGRGDPLGAGTRFATPGIGVQILALTAGQPVHTRYTFDVPLEDPSLLFMHSSADGLRRLVLPAVGQALRLPRPALPRVGASAPLWADARKREP